MCWILLFVSFAVFNNVLSSPKAKQRAELLLCFRLLSVFLDFQVLRGPKQNHTKLMKRLLWIWRRLFKKRCWEAADVSLAVLLRFSGGVDWVESGGVTQGHIVSFPSYSIWKSALCLLQTFWLLYEEQGEAPWAQRTTDLYLAEGDRWEATRKVKWSHDMDLSSSPGSSQGFLRN